MMRSRRVVSTACAALVLLSAIEAPVRAAEERTIKNGGPHKPCEPAFVELSGFQWQSGPGQLLGGSHNPPQSPPPSPPGTSTRPREEIRREFDALVQRHFSPLLSGERDPGRREKLQTVVEQFSWNLADIPEAGRDALFDRAARFLRGHEIIHVSKPSQDFLTFIAREKNSDGSFGPEKVFRLPAHHQLKGKLAAEADLYNRIHQSHPSYMARVRDDLGLFQVEPRNRNAREVFNEMLVIEQMFHNQSKMADGEKYDALLKARGEFLADHAITTVYNKGGFGMTFLARDKNGKESVFKIAHEIDGNAKFRREAEMNNLAHGKGVGMASTFRENIGMLEMEYRPGMTWNQFVGELRSTDPKIKAQAQAKLPEILEASARALDALHAFKIDKDGMITDEGLLHMDISGGNLYILKDPRTGELAVKFIDMGGALKTSEARAHNEDPLDDTISGTFAYMHRSMLADNKRIAAADQYGLRILWEQALSEKFPVPNEPHTHPHDMSGYFLEGVGGSMTRYVPRPWGLRLDAPEFVKSRPLLRGLFLLMHNAPKADAQAFKGDMSYGAMTALALKEKPTEAETRRFWDAFRKHLDSRSDAEVVNILFGDPGLFVTKDKRDPVEARNAFLATIPRGRLLQGLTDIESRGAPQFQMGTRPEDAYHRLPTEPSLFDVDYPGLYTYLDKPVPEMQRPATVASGPDASAPVPDSRVRQRKVVESRLKKLALAALGLGGLAIGGKAMLNSPGGSGPGPIALDKKEHRKESGNPSAALLPPDPPPGGGDDGIDVDKVKSTPAGPKGKTDTTADLEMLQNALKVAQGLVHHAVGGSLTLGAQGLRELQELAKSARHQLDDIQRRIEADKKARLEAEEAEKRKTIELEKKKKADEADRKKIETDKKKAEAERLRKVQEKCWCRGEPFENSRACVLRDWDGNVLAWSQQTLEDPFCWKRCSPESNYVDPYPIIKKVRKDSPGTCKTVELSKPTDWQWGPGAGYGGWYYYPKRK